MILQVDLTHGDAFQDDLRLQNNKGGFSRWWNFKYFLYSSLFGEDFQFDDHIFQMGWFNHQLGKVGSSLTIKI